MAKKKLKKVRKRSLTIRLKKETDNHLFIIIAISDNNFKWHELKLKIPKSRFKEM